MYIELCAQTYFSFLMGASSPEEWIQRCQELNYSALGITDYAGVYGIPKAYWHAKSIPNFKLIVGSQVPIEGQAPLTLIARNRAGYGLMCRILTAAHADKPKGKASILPSELESFLQQSESNGLWGIASASANLDWLTPLLPNRLAIAIHRFKQANEEGQIAMAKKISQQWAIPLVATQAPLYHHPQRRPVQDILTSIRENIPLTEAGYRLFQNAERYLKSATEMKELFSDLPAAIEQTAIIANDCHFSMSELRYRYPSEWIPKPHNAQSYLEQATWVGAKKRYSGSIPLTVEKQIHHELGLIKQMNYADYFLTIFDIVQFARQREILCQGRGSAANSVVCYCLEITAVDPVRMNLLFERFISIERNEPPDIDVDFEHERREEVIQYIYQKYGRHRAAMVSAVVTYQKRSVLREVAKAFGIPVGTLSAKAIVRQMDELESKTSIPNVRQKIETFSETLTGFPRHLSIHSGGFTLSADPIIEIVPVEPARMEGRTIIQWDKYDLDYLGLLKVDILALGMLSAIRKTLGQVNLELHQVPADDPKTYAMIQHADTVGTFQVESRAQMNMSGRLQPRNFYDLVVQVAIVRPGPIVGKMVHPYLKRRRGEQIPEYPHPVLRKILGRTLGVPIFQEQLMKLAIELGGFTPGESDQLRRAIGAWRSTGSIEKAAERLLEGFKKNGIPDSYSKEILECMKGFAHYGFPESHAASFALLTYVSCYLKCHHPAEFACGLLNSQPMGFYSTHSIVDDSKRHGVRVLPVDPQTSIWDSTLESGALRLGLRTISGISKTEATRIIENRPFRSLGHFLSTAQLKPNVLMRLALAKGLDAFGTSPRTILWKILAEDIRQRSDQLDLFSENSLTETDDGNPTFPELGAFETVERDYEAYGLSPREHPMRALRRTKVIGAAKIPPDSIFAIKKKPPKSWIKTAGMILIRQRPPTANGVFFAAIEDETGILDLVLFKKEYERYREVFMEHAFVVVTGIVERDGHSVSVIIKKLDPVFSYG